MATQLLYGVISPAALASFKGDNGEIVLDNTNYRLVICDGVTAGGHPLAKLNDIPTISTYTVATLPASPATGELAFATNCRVFNGAGTQEGSGLGTGGLVSYNGTAWKIVGTNVTAIA